MCQGHEYVRRPPLGPNFWVPSQDELLVLEPGDFVKLIFDLPEGGERMWVKITNTDIDYTDLWEGQLDNHPLGSGVRLGDTILFHPYDAIDYIDVSAKEDAA